MKWSYFLHKLVLGFNFLLFVFNVISKLKLNNDGGGIRKSVLDLGQLFYLVRIFRATTTSINCYYIILPLAKYFNRIKREQYKKYWGWNKKNLRAEWEETKMESMEKSA